METALRRARTYLREETERAETLREIVMEFKERQLEAARTRITRDARYVLELWDKKISDRMIAEIFNARIEDVREVLRSNGRDCGPW